MQELGNLSLTHESSFEQILDKSSYASGRWGLVGKLPKVIEYTERFGPTDITVLITGETGTGKELVAKALWQVSKRCEKPLVTAFGYQCSADMIGDYLVGHVRGAFTGALTELKGKFEQADNGTIFFDELGDLTPALQTLLLRFVQFREYEKLGTNRVSKSNARIIGATNQPLDELVAEGKFRKDLYYRFCVAHIELPPLRNRPDDVPYLVDHFLSMYSKEYLPQNCQFSRFSVDGSFLEFARSFDWPGNVRQLENVIQKAMALSRDGIITRQDVEGGLLKETKNGSFAHNDKDKSYTLMERTEKDLIVRIMGETGNNVLRSAERLGISRQTLYNKLEYYEVNNSPHSETADSFAGRNSSIKRDTGAVKPEASGLDEEERRFIVDVLKKARGNIEQAAQEIGITNSRLKKKIEVFRINLSDYAGDNGVNSLLNSGH